jgi:cation diffusion facilitator family transporter
VAAEGSCIVKNLSVLLHAGDHASPRAVIEQRVAMGLSLATGVLMLVGKLYAYAITDSAAIMSDAAESVVHLFAVGFAAYSLWLSQQPADHSHPYGHEKIGYFSAGMEGVLIIIAGLFILYSSAHKWAHGLSLQNLSTGTMLVAAAAVINGVLGGFLVWKGRRTGSVILTANGHHVLTDVWTSAGVVAGLLLTMATGWLPFDPIVAMLAAGNILWTGAQLMRQSVGGLMDEGDPELEALVRRTLDEETRSRGFTFHQMRYRASGTSLWIEVHLLLPGKTSLARAHAIASEVEAALLKKLPVTLHFTSHLEPLEKHDEQHAHSAVTDD